jgi:hypothetical protein
MSQRLTSESRYRSGKTAATALGKFHTQALRQSRLDHDVDARLEHRRITVDSIAGVNARINF